MHLFVWIDALRPIQQLWSCQDFLWDVYPTLGCHDTQNMLENNPSPNPLPKVKKEDVMTPDLVFKDPQQ